MTIKLPVLLLSATAKAQKYYKLGIYVAVRLGDVLCGGCAVVPLLDMKLAATMLPPNPANARAAVLLLTNEVHCLEGETVVPLTLPHSKRFRSHSQGAGC